MTTTKDKKHHKHHKVHFSSTPSEENLNPQRNRREEEELETSVPPRHHSSPRGEASRKEEEEDNEIEEDASSSSSEVFVLHQTFTSHTTATYGSLNNDSSIIINNSNGIHEQQGELQSQHHINDHVGSTARRPSKDMTILREEHVTIDVGQELLTTSLELEPPPAIVRSILTPASPHNSINNNDEISITAGNTRRSSIANSSVSPTVAAIVPPPSDSKCNVSAEPIIPESAATKTTPLLKRVQSSGLLLHHDVVLPSEMSRSKKSLHERLKIKRKKKQEARLKYGTDTSTSEPIMNDDEQSHFNMKDCWRSFKKGMKTVRLLCVGTPAKKVYDLSVHDIKQVKTVIVDLVYALIAFGMPIYRVEFHCSRIAICFGINCYLDATNSGFLITFADTFDDENTDTRYIKVSNCIDLNKLCQLDDVADDIASNRVSILDAQKRIKDIIKEPPIYAHFLFTLFSYTVSSACFSIFISCLWQEVVAAIVCGFMVALTTVIVCKFFPTLGPVLPAVSAVVSGLIAIAFKAIYTRFSLPMQVMAVALSGVIICMPGLSITTSVQELTSRQIRSGALRFVGAFSTSVQLAAGLLIVRLVEEAINFRSITGSPFPYPKWALALIVPCNAVGFMVSLKAPRYPLVALFIIANCYQAYFVTNAVSKALRPELGALVGAFCIQTVSKVYGWISRHPPSVVTSCAILLQVPGSVSVRGISALISKDLVSGTQLLLLTLQIATGLAIGLILSNFFFAWINHKHSELDVNSVKQLFRKSKTPDLESGHTKKT